MSTPHYTPGGHWMPSFPGRVCASCGKTYTAHRKDQKCCSRTCTGAYRRAQTPKKYKACAHCGELFEIPNGGGKSRKAAAMFCSRDCVRDGHGWRAPVEHICDQCGETFTAPVKDEAKHRFCSTTCADAHRGSGKVSKPCANCGEIFTSSPCRADEQTCSRECASAWYVRDRSKGWQGGVVDQNGRKFRRIDRDGYAAKYEGEHRLAAERVIGRKIKRGEVVLCIDGNNDNFAAENLYMLPSQKEFGLVKMGTLPWPTESNLATYRERGYVRPDVVIVLHEWTNGKRMNAKGNRHIRRHPQADEIIIRRRAGASVRDLARDFGTSMSTMAATLRNRL